MSHWLEKMMPEKSERWETSKPVCGGKKRAFAAGGSDLHDMMASIKRLCPFKKKPRLYRGSTIVNRKIIAKSEVLIPQKPRLIGGLRDSEIIPFRSCQKLSKRNPDHKSDLMFRCRGIECHAAYSSMEPSPPGLANEPSGQVQVSA